MLRSDVGTGFLQLFWKKPIWEGVWPYLDPWDSELIEFAPCISAETVKACGLIGLHMMAEEYALRSSPDPGEMWTYGCPESPVWGSNGVKWAGSEDAFSLECYEHNVGNLAVEVVGQNWSSEVIHLFLEDWEVGRVASSCHLSIDLLCKEMRDACWERSKSLGSPRSLCSVCWEGRRRCSDAWVPSFNVKPGL